MKNQVRKILVGSLNTYPHFLECSHQENANTASAYCIIKKRHES